MSDPTPEERARRNAQALAAEANHPTCACEACVVVWAIEIRAAEQAATLRERERCAQFIEGVHCDGTSHARIAAAIRGDDDAE